MNKSIPARSKIEKSSNGLHIKIPARKSALIIILMAVWLVAWFSGGAWIISDVINSPSVLMTVILLLWIGGGLLVAKQLLWEFIGEQEIIVSRDYLTLEIKMLNRCKRERFEWLKVKNLRLTPQQEAPEASHEEGSDELMEPDDLFENGLLEFEYGNRILRFARNIDEPEAEVLLEELEIFKSVRSDHFSHH